MNLLEAARRLRRIAYANEAWGWAYMRARHAAYLATGIDVATE